MAPVARGRRDGFRATAVALTLGIVLIMTAIFDNVMIGVGLVGYDPDLISGQFIGIAPLEDFAYAVAAVVLLPALWVILSPRARPRVGAGAGAGAGVGLSEGRGARPSASGRPSPGARS